MLILCCALAARAAARSRATFSLGVSSEPLLVLKGELVEAGSRGVGGWYEKVDAAGGFEDACGEVEVNRVKLSEGGRRDIFMKGAANCGLYQIQVDHRTNSISYTRAGVV
jgi:hypothetical protein